MEEAKAAINKFTGNRGHQTDVEELVNPSVTSETIKPHRHEETTQAIDREVHQHHYHTTVQPIQHQETLPEKHTHNMLPVETREKRFDNHEETQNRVKGELAQFKDHSTTHETHHTTAAAPAVTGEHVHHHVHETVQPVIHKETIQPEVVHTTHPVHEVHHHSAEHHGLSALPMKTLDEFKKAGGILTGNSNASREEYEGPPRPYNEKLKTTIEKVLPGHHGSSQPTSTDHRKTDSGVAGVTGYHGSPTTTSPEHRNIDSGGVGAAGHHGLSTTTSTTTNTTIEQHRRPGSGGT